MVAYALVRSLEHALSRSVLSSASARSGTFEISVGGPFVFDLLLALLSVTGVLGEGVPLAVLVRHLACGSFDVALSSCVGFSTTTRLGAFCVGEGAPFILLTGRSAARDRFRTQSRTTRAVHRRIRAKSPTRSVSVSARNVASRPVAPARPSRLARLARVLGHVVVLNVGVFGVQSLLLLTLSLFGECLRPRLLASSDSLFLFRFGFGQGKFGLELFSELGRKENHFVLDFVQKLRLLQIANDDLDETRFICFEVGGGDESSWTRQDQDGPDEKINHYRTKRFGSTSATATAVGLRKNAGNLISSRKCV